jgi:quercetin dioxygenase-like cupin family protein
MLNPFPPPILNLPQADIPLTGATAYLSQTETQQILFMCFEQDVILNEHAHAAQWGIVLEGQIELTIAGVSGTYQRGDRYFIPAGVKHSGKIHAGYADITCFDQPDRYLLKDAH